MTNYLIQYREAIRRGEIRAGYDMTDELDRLIADLGDPQYRYDTAAAELRIDFIENCVKLTKAPFYGKPMKLLLWENAFIEVVYSFEIRDIDSGEWGLVEYGIDGEATLPVVALTRPISDADHVPRRLKSVKVCGQFRHRCQTDEPLLCTLLWGSNDQYHWHLVGSSRCTTLQLSTGSPWRWHRIAVAGWMAPDERLGHIMVRGEG